MAEDINKPIFLRQKEIEIAHTLCVYDVLYCCQSNKDGSDPKNVVIFLMDDKNGNKFKAVHTTQFMERVLEDYDKNARKKLEEISNESTRQIQMPGL